mmetsp:Transcript_1301/g.3311  ORF Transcript_1301/g.3311 Transcript_1301/m.3311 type:complete len:283 (-) Transcript_1301:409-1257(-)|eukprot:CAMPEP_0172374456 /NCGR_PEP_ID=MMETSP1060-20121228/55906_1 /TAXON_ID=37318 /ORGANISM="Pseudo-nitzschia pungens, Strain cf. cingulata" /LENGTH=282 /DNA_ID=CAMNT_0013101145 /DNA_START=46 /DNA_END=894 /DNA_ORIENTATION=+
MTPRQDDFEAERENEYNVRSCCAGEALADDNDDRIDVLLFDLDGTLYDHSCGYEEEIHSNIFKFMVESRGGKFDAITTLEEAKQAWKPIFDKYNLTKRGLLGEGYVFDSKYYDEYIRKGAAKYFSKDDALRAFLESFPSRMKKVVFTNAPESSANEILHLLGVSDLFDAVLGTDFLESRVCKPEPEAFAKVLGYLFPVVENTNNSLSSIAARNRRICYFEDSFKNLQAGKKLGFRTVFITSETLASEGKSTRELEEEQFDAIVHKCVNMSLKSQLPQLWEGL